MAGQLAHVTSGEVTLVANTAKSCLQIKAATNQRVIVEALRITGKQPAGGTDTPVKVRMTRSTANFGTFSAATPAKNNPSNGETIQTTCGSNASVEPTSPTDGGLWWEVQPQSGVIEFYPPDMRIEVPGGQSIQFEATSPGTPILTMTATFEE
jgi:hypothetical protein